tara:strand:+ start:1323 stop:1817 length:495 start_codon:yes stop_codon:yes gene_type:complete
MDEVKYQITLNEEQMRVLREALDNYARMGMGQLDISVAEFLRRHFCDLDRPPLMTEDPGDDPTFVPTEIDVWVAVRGLVVHLKQWVFNHPPEGSWGISNEKVPEICREAYDMKQVIRKALFDAALDQLEPDSERQMTLLLSVDQRPYIATNPKQTPIKVERKTS